MQNDKNNQGNLLWAHILPLGVFTAVLIFSSSFVTACSPQSQSLLKNAQLGELKSNTSNAPSAEAAALAELKLKLPGNWIDSSTGEKLDFNTDLSGLTIDHTIQLEGDQGTCHVKHDYQMTYKNDAAEPQVIVDLQLSTKTLGQLVDDPSNSMDCSDHFKVESRPNLVVTEKVEHSDDWSEITFKTHKFHKMPGSDKSSPSPSPSSQKVAQAESAEAWVGL